MSNNNSSKNEPLNSANGTGMKYDNGKLLMTLISPQLWMELAEVLTFGAEKYEPNSWQSVPDAKRRYEVPIQQEDMDSYYHPLPPEQQIPCCVCPSLSRVGIRQGFLRETVQERRHQLCQPNDLYYYEDYQ